MENNAIATWDFRDLMREQKEWSLRNFGEHPPWQPLLGIVEEIGELTEATETADILDACADVMVFMADLCNCMGFDLEEIFIRALDDRDLLQRSVPISGALTVAAGRLSHAYLKLVQGIRGSKEQHEQAMRDALALITWQVEARVAVRGESLLDVVHETWQEVKKRDWRKKCKTCDAKIESPDPSVTFCATCGDARGP